MLVPARLFASVRLPPAPVLLLMMLMLLLPAVWRVGGASTRELGDGAVTEARSEAGAATREAAVPKR